MSSDNSANNAILILELSLREIAVIKAILDASWKEMQPELEHLRAYPETAIVTDTLPPLMAKIDAKIEIFSKLNKEGI